MDILGPVPKTEHGNRCYGEGEPRLDPIRIARTSGVNVEKSPLYNKIRLANSQHRIKYYIE
jgi:hypothetical protein